MLRLVTRSTGAGYEVNKYAGLLPVAIINTRTKTTWERRDLFGIQVHYGGEKMQELKQTPQENTAYRCTQLCCPAHLPRNGITHSELSPSIPVPSWGIVPKTCLQTKFVGTILQLRFPLSSLCQVVKKKVHKVKDREEKQGSDTSWKVSCCPPFPPQVLKEQK